jgi:1-phosphatidylinositol-3-phosphate 5-kinase
MDATASKPTVLAKLMGFYTVEVKNLETGVVQAKADLLVMENIFYGRNISKKFDLKGIQGRKVKAPGNASKTLFDGEWIEGMTLSSQCTTTNLIFVRIDQQKTLTLIRPYSKVLLQDAIKNDAEFLSKSNIMDYSLAYFYYQYDFIDLHVAVYFWESMKRKRRSRAASSTLSVSSWTRHIHVLTFTT